MSCDIVPVGKRRDGGTRYWCLKHRGDATAKYGRKARECRYARVPPITAAERHTIRAEDYPGGVALWGAVPPIYDTSSEPPERGIHVHARKRASQPLKDIDESFREVTFIAGGQEPVLVSEVDAIYFMVSTVMGYRTKWIPCTLCDYPHLDKDWFSVHPHRRHLCAGCGRTFRDSEGGIGNPLASLHDSALGKPRTAVRAAKSLNIAQRDYPGGIQIWGSNPAIVWLSKKPEESGIHVHAFDAKGNRIHDDTFSSVVIDGIRLDEELVRLYMAQSVLPHLAGRTTSISCPSCNAPHQDSGDLRFIPHDQHVCVECGCTFRNPGRLKKTIGNPMAGILKRLSLNAVRTPSRHDLGLLPETL